MLPEKAASFRTLNDARGNFGPCALAIGNFDGVHIGHQQLVEATVAWARQRGITPAVLTFDPHPTSVVAPHRLPVNICSLAERLRLLEEAGARKIFVLEFTGEIARLSPEQFVADILLDTLAVEAVFVGENFRFGFGQAGTPAILAQLGTRYGFATQFIPPVRFRGEMVSSSAVREAITQHRLARAAHLLGRFPSLTGPVVSGRGIGSKQAVPTLNLAPPSPWIIPPGIYVTQTEEQAGGRCWPSVTSCGYNPTFGRTDLTVETYLLDELTGRTPAEIEVQFRRYLRAEETYPDAAALKNQIMRDVAHAQAYWRHARELPPALRTKYVRLRTRLTEPPPKGAVFTSANTDSEPEA